MFRLGGQERTPGTLQQHSPAPRRPARNRLGAAFVQQPPHLSAHSSGLNPAFLRRKLASWLALEFLHFSGCGSGGEALIAGMEAQRGQYFGVFGHFFAPQRD